MEKITLNEGLMARMMESEAWKNISGNYPFSEVQLDRFGDRIPDTEFKDSRLWDELVERKEKEVKRTLCLVLTECGQECAAKAAAAGNFAETR